MNDTADDQAEIVQTRADGGTTDDHHAAARPPSEAINSRDRPLTKTDTMRYVIQPDYTIRVYCKWCETEITSQWQFYSHRC